MNRKICIISACILSITILIFFIALGISLFLQTPITGLISYVVCILLSWTYVLTSIGHSMLCNQDRKVAAEAGKLFAVIYAVFICIAYFTQLTVVRQNVLSAEVVNAFDFNHPGSWLFSLDIIGYGIMALSTFFVGLTIEAKNKVDIVLKWLLLIHSVFIICTVLPSTSMFLGGNNSGNSGSIALMGWCLMFFPIAILSMIRFKHADKM